MNREQTRFSAPDETLPTIALYSMSGGNGIPLEQCQLKPIEINNDEK